MGHDLHFLQRLARLDDAGVAFALSLYRNVPLVKAIVQEAAPAGTTRVALAIGDGPQPPHVLVERDGHFVTCLAAGMAHDLPVISRPAVERAARRSEELREALRVLEELKRTPDAVRETMKVHGGPWLAREDAQLVLAWAPVLDDEYFRAIERALSQNILAWGTLAHKEQFKERHLPEMRRAWREGWAVGHLQGPAASTFRRLYETYPQQYAGMHNHPALAGIATRVFGTALRGLWTLASLGEAVVDDLATTLLKGGEDGAGWASAFGMAAIALRWPRLRGRARDVLARCPLPSSEPDPDDEQLLAQLRHIVDHPQEALARQLEEASAWYAAKGGDPASLDTTTLRAASLYDERIVSGPTSFRRYADAVPFLAASSWEELYLPRAVLDALPPPDPDESAWAYAEGRRAHNQRMRAEEAAKTPPAPVRNAACACGSGKKYKRCCGQ